MTRYSEEWLADRLRAQQAREPAKPPQKPRQCLEDAQQVSLFEWAQYVTIGSHVLADVMFHTPNGGYRTAYEAGKFKAMGVKSGLPDIGLPVPAGHYIGGWWELKVGKNKPSENQIEWHKLLKGFGHYVCVCWRWEEAAADIVRYLSQSKFTVVVRAKLSI